MRSRRPGQLQPLVRRRTVAARRKGALPLAKRAASRLRPLFSPPVGRSKLDHRPPDNFSRPEQVNRLVDLIERDGLDRVADLALSGKRHDLAQVGITDPERAVEGLFLRHPREQLNLDAIGKQYPLARV